MKNRIFRKVENTKINGIFLQISRKTVWLFQFDYIHGKNVLVAETTKNWVSVAKFGQKMFNYLLLQTWKLEKLFLQRKGATLCKNISVLIWANSQKKSSCWKENEKTGQKAKLAIHAYLQLSNFEKVLRNFVGFWARFFNSQKFQVFKWLSKNYWKDEFGKKNSNQSVVSLQAMKNEA